MDFIIADLEATCWEGKADVSEMEIIEIGAVRLIGTDLIESGEFSRFVRPSVHPELSPFCLDLTSIRQEWVDQAGTFPLVFGEFLAWIGSGDATLCSWGRYDLHQLEAECRRHGIAVPPEFGRHINLKREFARLKKAKECEMKRALDIAGLPLMGIHHRGIDDARNIASLARLILPFAISFLQNIPQ